MKTKTLEEKWKMPLMSLSVDCKQLRKESKIHGFKDTSIEISQTEKQREKKIKKKSKNITEIQELSCVPADCVGLLP